MSEERSRYDAIPRDKDYWDTFINPFLKKRGKSISDYSSIHELLEEFCREFDRQMKTSPQRKLLDIIKEIDYGEIEKIVIRRGLPVFVQVAKQDIKLD